MEAVELKPKNECKDMPIVVFDELIKGVLSNEMFVPVFSGAQNGLRVIPLSYLVDNYRWPKKAGKVQSRIYYYLTGNDPVKAKNVECYVDETVEV